MEDPDAGRLLGPALLLGPDLDRVPDFGLGLAALAGSLCMALPVGDRAACLPRVPCVHITSGFAVRLPLICSDLLTAFGFGWYPGPNSTNSFLSRLVFGFTWFE